MREDSGLMGWAVPDHCRLLFELRIGRAIRQHQPSDSGATVKQTADSLRSDIEEEIHEDVALAVAEVIADSGTEDQLPWPWKDGPTPTLISPQKVTIQTANDDWKHSVQLFANLTKIACETWETDEYPTRESSSRIIVIAQVCLSNGRKK